MASRPLKHTSQQALHTAQEVVVRVASPRLGESEVATFTVLIGGGSCVGTTCALSLPLPARLLGRMMDEAGVPVTALNSAAAAIEEEKIDKKKPL